MGKINFTREGWCAHHPLLYFLLQIFCQFGRQVECIVFVNVYDYRIQADFFPAFLSDRHDVAERRDVDLLLLFFTTSEGEPFSSLAGTYFTFEIFEYFRVRSEVSGCQFFQRVVCHAEQGTEIMIQFDIRVHTER